MFALLSAFGRRVHQTRLFGVFLLITAFALSLSGTSFAIKEKQLPAFYRQWLTRDVVYLITSDEKESFLQLTTDEQRDKFIEQFWEIRDPDPASPGNSYKDDIYARIAYANQFFGHETGTEGWRTDMGRVYITLGPPEQKAPYFGQANVRPMQIWFYSGKHPGLPPFFYVVFYQRETGGDFKLYSPYMDGPGKLTSSASTEGNKLQSLKVIDQQLGREVARTTLSLLPDEPVDMANATASLSSDVLLNNIRNLANTSANKDLLRERRRILEAVSHRFILGGDYLDVLTVPLRDAAGVWNLHYLLRFKKPEDFTLVQAQDGRYFYNVEVVAKVSTPDGKPVFEQHRKLSAYIEEKQLESVKRKTFGYEGLLPLAPGKYKIEFTLANEAQKTAYRDEKEVTVPSTPASGFGLSNVVPFSEAEAGKAGLAPFTVAGVKFTPMIGHGISVVPGRDLKFFYQIWSSTTGPQTLFGSNLSASYTYGRMGQGDAKTVEDSVLRSQFDSSGSMVNGKKISTFELAPGMYRLNVAIEDPETKKKSYSGFQFRVAPTEATADAWDVSDPQLGADFQSGKLDFDRARSFEAQGDDANALKLYRLAFQQNPHSEEIRAKLVDAVFAKQNFAEIVDVYSRSGISEKTDEKTILRIAESLDRTGSVRKSIQVLESAIAIRPESAPLHMALADYYQRAGETGRADEMQRKGKALLGAAQPTS